MNKGKVVVGMSGGVDSSVAAYLLKEEGYDVVGVTMQIWQEELDQAKNSGCADSSAVVDARKVAEALDIPHYVLDFKEEFEDKVMSYFVEEYLSGRTPNPCNTCNRYVKWEALLNRSAELGADYIATGHYAQIEQLENGRYAIKHSLTAKKDQTYALYNLTQEQLSKTLMPVGKYQKDEIREIAKLIDLPVANKPDSQDICFVPNGDYASFIEKKTGQKGKPGNFVNIKGEVIGEHKGIVHYTIGQRKGLNLAMGHPVFVVEIRPQTNEVVIGESEDLFSKTVKANKVNFMAVGDIEDEVEFIAKIRYSHDGSRCLVKRAGEDELLCEFEEAQRAITPGQAIVLYQGEYVAGGGTIL